MRGPTGKDSAVDVGTRVGCVVPRVNGGYAMGACQDFLLYGTDGLSHPEERIHITDETLVRVNDGKRDPAGRFFAGMAANDGRWGTGALYRLGSDHSLERVLPGVTCANGLGWSLDSKTFYYVDTPTYRVDAFDFDPGSGSLSKRRVFARIEGGGRPDGLCVDSEGCLWVAIWLGWEVRRYAPDGRLLQRVKVPTALVSSCAFAGPDLDVPVHHVGVQLPDEGRKGGAASRRGHIRLCAGGPGAAARSVRRLNAAVEQAAERGGRTKGITEKAGVARGPVPQGGQHDERAE